jgi:histidinol-phosphatase (PHP family)
MLVSDYHNHPLGHREDLKYCPALLQPWANRALELGLRDIAFTDHDRYKSAVFLDEIDKLQETYPGIKFRKGIELDNDPESSSSGRAWVEDNWDNLDFVLGSVHFVKDFPFDHPNYISEYSKIDINDLYIEYYKNIQTIAMSGLVDGISHFDLIKIFKFFPTQDLSSLYDETLDLIKEKDLSLEINTAGWRKPIGEQYPSLDLIKKAVNKSIPITISSDAHAAKDLGLNYDRLKTIIEAADIKKIAIYEKHQRAFYNIS